MITDIQNMPNYSIAVENGKDSVSTGKVFVHEQPYCKIHGAMNCMTNWDGNNGRIWRCITCNVGAYEIKGESK